MEMSQAKSHFPNIAPTGDAVPFVNHILEILDHIKLFEDFERDEVSVLARYMTCYEAVEGVEIIREGDMGDFMLLVLDGTLEVVKKNSQGLPARIALVGTGKTLGEMSVIDGEPRFASCVALTPVRFAVLARETLTRIIADEPKIGIKILMEFLMLLNQRLRTVSSQLVQCVEQRQKRIGR